MSFLDKKCKPCEGGVPPFTPEETQAAMLELHTDWRAEGYKIKRGFLFKGFQEAIDFVNKVATLAEEEGHHPDISIHYNKVDIELWTHAIGGLSENDFILAAKIDQL